MQAKTTAASPAPDEKAIAEAILKRAEIARITRQLKTKLLRAKNKTEASSSTSSPSKAKAGPLPTPPSSQTQLARKRSHASFNEQQQQQQQQQVQHQPPQRRTSSHSSNSTDGYETDEYESPTKKAHTNNNIPSSPLYTIGETIRVPVVPPSTPPRKSATLASRPQETSNSTGTTGTSSYPSDVFSTPKSKVINTRSTTDFKTPTSTTSHKMMLSNKTPGNTSDQKKKKQYGTSGHAAELLMFFANSPSPAPAPAPQSRKVLPTTPKRLFHSSGNTSTAFASTPPTSAGIAAANALGSTPLSASQHSRAMDIFSSGSSNSLHPSSAHGHKFSPPVTPGKRGSSFVLNDFVTSVFTPSPRR